jgi:NTE family protein
VRRLSDKGFLMKVPAGELLTEKGLAQQELFVIVSGVFEVYDGERRLRVIGPGDVVGEVAFFGSSGRRSASVSAASDGQVLVLRRHFLDQLREKEPAIAADVLFELARALADRVYLPAGD